IISAKVASAGQAIGLQSFSATRVPWVDQGFSEDFTRALERTQQLETQVSLLLSQGRFPEARPLGDEWLTLQLQWFGVFHPTTAMCLNDQATLLVSEGRMADSIAVREEALSILKKLFPAAHPKIAMGHNNLGDAYNRGGRTSEAQSQCETALAMYRQLYPGDHPKLAGAINNLATVHEALGQWANAERDYVEVLAMTRRLYRGDHIYVAIGLNNLAQIRTRLGQGAEAETLYEESLAILQRLFPDDHPAVALSLGNLAHVRTLLGKGREAEPLNVESLAMYRRLYTGDHPDVVRAHSNLAFVYDSIGKEAEAELLYEESLKMIRRLFPGDHPDVALALNNLADVRRSLSREGDAEPLFVEALEMRKRLFSGDHPDIAVSLENLAMVYHSQGRSGDAEPLCVESLAMSRRLLPGDHPYIAKSLHNLAAVRESLGRRSEAVALYEESLSISSRVFPGDHPFVANCLESLANVLRTVGRSKEAEQHAEGAVAMNRRLFPFDHPDMASSLLNLASVRMSLGRPLESEPLCEEAVAMSARLLETAATFQSEAMQMAMSSRARRYMSSYFSVVLHEPINLPLEPTDALIQQALRLKGAVFMRQRWMRLAPSESVPEAINLCTRLRDAAARLSHLQRNPPNDSHRWNAWREQVQLARDEYTMLQQQLSAASADFRALQQQNQAGWREIQEQLGTNVALVDLHECWKSTGEMNEDGQPFVEPALCALIVRDGVRPRLVELAFISEIDRWVSEWRKTKGAVSSTGDSGAELRRLLWEPLVPHIDKTTTVVVSPAGSTSLVPWNALPGRDAGTYLIEEYAIAVAPIPQLLLATEAPLEKHESRPTMLVVADVDYNADPGVTRTTIPSENSGLAVLRSGGKQSAWNPLPNARTEATGVRDSFERAFPDGSFRWLRGSSATEQMTRETIAENRFVHLATHGFFEGPVLGSADNTNTDLGGPLARGNVEQRVMDRDPLLLSGLVLAGANRAGSDGRDDGILLALDVAVLDLRAVELATLSACETGLGQEVRGEGVLGLQRAFQLAGAKTTVTSLWKVDDATAQQLMNMFYENLWHGGMSKLEALRQAQLSLLREHRSRGGEDELKSGQTAVTTEHWAAWVLAGDWR
ncbi:MAG: CHAT domain-containing protein, partial [Pirellulaceae bacterium]|nr:CHAT domain-containing protein [Pirellulaceae bacterium]